MKADLLEFMNANRMTRPGDHVICALSGGKDSMALLHLLLALRGKLGIAVSAVHFNHQLRGQESQRDEEFVAAQCRALGVPLFVGRGSVRAFADARHLGLEEAARSLRYQFFQTLPEHAKIATAHTAEDNLETMLLHLLRGCSLHGLSGIPPVRGNVIRPLLLTERREIETYLTEHNIPHVEDSSNASDDFQRNRLRHHVLPALLAENPSLPGSVSHLCTLLAQEDNMLSQLARQHLNALLKDQALSCSGLLQLPEAMALRVLALFLEPVPSLSRRHLDAARNLCAGDHPSGQLSLPGGYILRRHYDELILLPKSSPSPSGWTSTISLGETVSFGPWRVSCQIGTFVPGCRNVIALTPEHIHFPLTLRSRRPGDRIRLQAGTKKLSDFMIDQKIPASLRNTIPVAVQEREILALLPFRSAEAYRPTPGQQAILLTLQETEEASCIQTLTM